MTEPYNIAVIENRPGLDAQGLLAEAAKAWRGQGIRLAGVIAQALAPDEAMCSADYLEDIATGQRHSMQLGNQPPDTQCHLDVTGLDDACGALLTQIPDCDILILSKFGKMEAERRGLWTAFEAAIWAGKPLLTTLSPKQRTAWDTLVPTATWLTPDLASVDRWRRGIAVQSSVLAS
jgi:nucleoside-triphosphatase THEP1